MWGNSRYLHFRWITVATCILTISNPLFSDSQDAQLFNSVSQVSATGDREPTSGATRLTPAETDIRNVVETPDRREVVISIWSPRVHPFKDPPSYTLSRSCLFGEIIESTIGIVDTTKSHILRKTGKGSKVPTAFEWNMTKRQLVEISPPDSFPFKYENLGKVFEFVKTGSCQYFPSPLASGEKPIEYFLKHIEIARLTHATDIIFPKTLFDFITNTSSGIGVDYTIQFSKLKDLNLDFAGSTFLLSPDKGGFLFKDSQRISIRNLKMEWASSQKKGNSAIVGPPLHGIYSPRDSNSDLWFENIHMKRVPGWAFYFDSTPGIYVAKSSVGRFAGDNSLASREGAIKIINSQDIIIKDNSFQNLGGDGISMHGQFGAVMTSPYLTKPETQDKAMLGCVGLGSTWAPYSVDESIGFFDSNFGFQGETRIKQITHFSLGDANTPSYCKGFVHCSEVCFTPHPDFSPVKGGYLTSLNKNPLLFTIKGNTFSDIAGKGISVQGSNGEILDNKVFRTSGPGLQLSADIANQLQGPGTYNIAIRNNQFEYVVTEEKYLRADEPFYGGITIGAAQKESDGRSVVVTAPLNQYLKISGANSLIDHTGSVALLISSAKSVEVSNLIVGSAGTLRNLNSGSLSGAKAEGSVLLTKCQQIDLAGLTTPPLVEKRFARNRTIVVDSQYATQIRVPISTRGLPGFSANTLWYTTFRGWFKEDISKTPAETDLIIESPGLSTFHKTPPLKAFSIQTPRVGDKETTLLDKDLSFTVSSTRWVSSGILNWQSPNRIQLRPSFKSSYPNLFLSFDKAIFVPKKQGTLPFES